MVTTKLATLEDKGNIEGLIRELGDAVEHLYDSLPQVERQKWLKTLAAMLNSPDWVFLLAQDSGKEVGLIVFHIFPNLFHGSNTALITELVVTKSERSRGIGRLLVEEASRVARDRGCREMEVTTEMNNEAAASFYLHTGFDHGHKYFEMEL